MRLYFSIERQVQAMLPSELSPFFGWNIASLLCNMGRPDLTNYVGPEDWDYAVLAGAPPATYPISTTPVFQICDYPNGTVQAMTPISVSLAAGYSAIDQTTDSNYTAAIAGVNPGPDSGDVFFNLNRSRPPALRPKAYVLARKGGQQQPVFSSALLSGSPGSVIQRDLEASGDLLSPAYTGWCWQLSPEALFPGAIDQLAFGFQFSPPRAGNATVFDQNAMAVPPSSDRRIYAWTKFVVGFDLQVNKTIPFPPVGLGDKVNDLYAVVPVTVPNADYFACATSLGSTLTSNWSQINNPVGPAYVPYIVLPFSEMINGQNLPVDGITPFLWRGWDGTQVITSEAKLVTKARLSGAPPRSPFEQELTLQE